VSLRDWLKHSWLVEHETSAEEIAGLPAIVERDLANAKVAGLSDDWKLNIAYNAALRAATAALHRLAASLRDDVVTWLRKNHAKLLRR